MKRLIILSTLMLSVFALFMTSCTKENGDLNNLNNEISSVAEVDFEALILENVVVGQKTIENDEELEGQELEEGQVTIELTPEEFEQALKLTFNTSEDLSNTYFEDADLRTIFRQNLQKVLLDNEVIETDIESRSFCNVRYFAEAYGNIDGYVSSSSNSFAYARSRGTSGLRASAFDCETYHEVYIPGPPKTCPFSNCNYCYARAVYSTGGSGSLIYGAGC